MLIVGLTGGIGSGKTTVADLFADLGIALVDADQISREVVLPGSPALGRIAERFGKEILTSNGELDRRQLRKIVFSSPEQKLWLEQQLHPLINELIRTRLGATQSPYCILVSPLLLETSQAELVDRILVIDVPVAVQLQRTVERDSSDEETIQAIIDSQIDRESRLARADDVLDNNLPLDSLPERVQVLHQNYLQLAEQGNRLD